MDPRRLHKVDLLRWHGIGQAEQANAAPEWGCVSAPDRVHRAWATIGKANADYVLGQYGIEFLVHRLVLETVKTGTFHMVAENRELNKPDPVRLAEGLTGAVGASNSKAGILRIMGTGKTAS